MTTTWTRIRLGLLLAAIFLLGALAGHLASRRFTPAPLATAAQTSLPPAASPTPPLSPGTSTDKPESRQEIMRATRTVMAQYRSILSLTEEQMQQLKPLFRETGLEMGHLPKGSTLRLNAVSAFHQKISPFLTPEQQQLCDGILDRVRNRTTDEIPTSPVPSPDPS